MATATELPRPGISVIQQFRTISPTIVTPTLVPCVVGVCKQIVSALVTDATGNSQANSDAVVAVPPIIVSTNPESYAGLDGLTLKVSVNNGVEQEVTFSDPTAADLTADQVKAQILATSGLTGWAPYTVTRGASTYLQLRGNNAGDGQSLKILDGTANSILGLSDFFESTGFSSYTNDKRFIAQAEFPDPRNNIDELDIDESTIRVFLNLGGTLQEVMSDESFLRNGHLAWVAGTVSLPTSGLLNKTLLLTLVKGGAEQTITFGGDFFALSGTLVVPGAVYGGVDSSDFSITKNSDAPVTGTFSSALAIGAAISEMNAAWALVYPGEDVCYQADADGTPNGAGAYIAFQAGGATPTGDVIKVNETADWADMGFTLGGGSLASSLVWTINNALSSPAASPTAVARTATSLQLISYNGYISIGTGTANATLGLTDNTVQYALQGVDDGDGDTKSALVRIHNEDFTLDPGAAQIVGTADLTGNIAIHRLTLQVALDGNPMQEIEFNGGPITPTNAYADPGTDSLGLIVNNTPVLVTFANPVDIDAAINAINAAAGLTVAYRSLNTGVYSAAGTYISFQVGGATDAGGTVVMDYSASTGNAWSDIGFTGTSDIEQTLTSAEIETTIDDTMGTGFSSIVSNLLQLDSAEVGAESKIEIGDGTANTILGLTAGDVNFGRAFKPQAGDVLYADGEQLATIVQVTPGGVSTDLRLDTKLSFASVLKRSWYIIAKSIPSTLPSTRPTPDLVIDLAGDITIKHDIIRDTRGDVVSTSVSDALMVTYEALRLDVTSKASTPALLTFESTDELEAALEPVNADNPLALGLYFALLNAPGVTVSGLGVDAYSSDSPFGTLAAFTRASTFLESKEVYALAPLTHESVVHQMWQTHVNNMSDPDARGERVVFINPDMPSRELDELAASGTDGDTTGVTNEFDTKISNLSTLVQAAGVDPSGTISVEDGLFLDIATDAYNYSISAINGTKITIRVTFAPGENDDSFYSTTNLPSPLISETFSVKVRGAELLDTDGDPDYAAIANTYQDLGKAYADRRVFLVAPDVCAGTIESVEQRIDGFYMCAAYAGMTGQQPPQQGFTNFPVTGFTRVIGSNDSFSNTQMNTAAAGGVWWVVQDVAGGPLTARHQLSTDLTSVETREYSITKVVDFTAKLMRAGLRNFIGKFNITQGFLDTLSTTIQGQLSFLTENGVLIGGDLNNIIQDKTNPDTVLIDVTLDVPYPCNYIRLTLIV